MLGIERKKYRAPTAVHFLKFSFTGICTFETDTCGFIHDPTGRFNWTRHQGSTASSGTGPSSDHTKGTAAGQLSFLHLWTVFY